MKEKSNKIKIKVFFSNSHAKITSTPIQEEIEMGILRIYFHSIKELTEKERKCVYVCVREREFVYVREREFFFVLKRIYFNLCDTITFD